jgi:hypothetical protein
MDIITQNSSTKANTVMAISKRVIDTRNRRKTGASRIPTARDTKKILEKIVRRNDE